MSDAGTGEDETGGEVREPDNSTVDDWFGQNVARDQEVADEVIANADSEEEAEAQFERQAEGEEKYREGHPPPDGPREGEKPQS
ncbi:MAG: hypothetical protein JWO77_2854 [Ilumatobacteraceae bacterium]|nr:hypothetical protein [Ilumatobacteraceae bacterium]